MHGWRLDYNLGSLRFLAFFRIPHADQNPTLVAPTASYLLVWAKCFPTYTGGLSGLFCVMFIPHEEEEDQGNEQCVCGRGGEGRRER